jgi:L-ascorbate metabolism protein UlaG (beta-lactamase superfamily)
MPDNKMKITLIGHMTVLLEIDGVHFLTDPWFGPMNLVERILAPRLAGPSKTSDEISGIDAMLVSHNHIDHFDAKAIELARRTGCTVIVSKGVAKRAVKSGLQNVVALQEGEMTEFRGIGIHAVHAEHPLAGDAIGLVANGSRSAYFSGDTRLSQKTIDDLSKFDIDVALAQGACAWYPFAGKDGMDLADLTHFAELASPGWTVPLHLDCIGKWLDHMGGVRISKDNPSQVSDTLLKWKSMMSSKSLGAKLLKHGEEWEPSGKETDAR